MTVTSSGRPSTASELEAVVGLHFTVTREREVEHALLVLGDALTRHGVAVSWVTTHRTVTTAGPSCTGAVGAWSDPDLLAGYLHVVGRESADVAEVLSTPGQAVGDEDERAVAAAAALRTRTEGRAVWFPGHDTLGDAVTVGDLLGRTAIERVKVLGSREVDPETVIHTRGFVRPRFRDGVLVLHAQPARGGMLVPFETPSPTPCCADHS